MSSEATWRTWAALALVVAATALELWWVWGIWMAYYAAVAIRDGEAFLVEPVAREASPVAFWIVTAMWAVSGVATVLYWGS